MINRVTVDHAKRNKDTFGHAMRNRYTVRVMQRETGAHWSCKEVWVHRQDKASENSRRGCAEKQCKSLQNQAGKHGRESVQNTILPCNHARSVQSLCVRIVGIAWVHKVWGVYLTLIQTHYKEYSGSLPAY